jgi:putative membrane protein
MKALLAAALVFVALFALGGGAGAVSTPALDQWWLQSSIQGDRFQVAGATYAEQHARTPQVRALAAQVAGDGILMLRMTSSLAKRSSVPVPSFATPTEQWQIDQLESLSGSSFEKAYTMLSALSHQQAIADDQREIAMGSSAAVKSLAKTNMRMLQVHLLLSRKAMKAV